MHPQSGMDGFSASWIQRMGQAGRRDKKTKATITGGLASRLFLTWCANDGLDILCSDKSISVSLGVASKLFELPSKSGSKQVKQIEKKFALTNKQRKRLLLRQLLDQMGTLKLFCLNFGCQHRRLQRYQATGSIDEAVYLIHLCWTSCLVSLVTGQKKIILCRRTVWYCFLKM